MDASVFLPDILKDLFVNEYQTQINNALHLYSIII